MSGFPEYNKSRFPKKQPKGFCRGCRGLILEKNRRTWCSQKCVETFDPSRVKFAAWSRDGGKCQMCGYQIDNRATGWNHGESYAANIERQKEAKARRAEYDHIKPHSEGGLFILENIRLLCRACHLIRTKEWRASKAKAPISYSPVPPASA